MNNYERFRCDKLPDGNRERFFATIFAGARHKVEPFLWTETDNEYQLYLDDSLSLVNNETIEYFKRLQRETRKTIAFYSNRPLTPALDLFTNTDETYVKLSYFKTDDFVFEKQGKDCGNALKTVEGYDPAQIEDIINIFVKDNRLCENDERLQVVYKNEIEEFDSDKENCAYLRLYHGDKLAAFIGGMWMGEEVYCYPVYLIAFIWINNGFEKRIIHESVCKIIDWLKVRGGPYGAGIQLMNSRSRHFFSKNGFQPYFARIFPWPK